MKNKFLLIAICIFSFPNIKAQENWDGYSVGQKYPGYIIKTDGTKIEGYLQAQELATPSDNPIGDSNQSKVIFFTDPRNNKTKTTYKPADLKEYQIADKVYRSIAYSGGLSSKALRFLLLQSDGGISEYAWYDNVGSRMYPKYETKIVLKKGNETPKEVQGFMLNFSTKGSELFKDYPELAKKVSDKENGYGYLQIMNIVEEYNKWYDNHVQ